MMVNDPRWELVQRVVGSHVFQRSTQLREFLLYVSEKAILNQPDEVTEQLVGIRVMGRRPDYDPNADNIVRVQARQLRMRLQEYFSGDGRGEALIVDIPKGSYLPVFKPRPAPVKAESFKLRGMMAALPWALAIVLAGVSLWLVGKLPERPAPILGRLPWSLLFDRDHTTTIVSADSCFALLQDIEHKNLGLKEYLAPAQLPKEGLSGVVAARQFTSFADMALAIRLVKLAEPYRDRIQVRYARNLQLRDFKSGNFILFGSSRSNPWVELFDSARNFRSEFDQESRRPFFRNKSPRTGEQDVYLTNGSDGRTGETYSVVAFLQGQDRASHVLIVEGTNMEGTEAAGDFITDLPALDRLFQTLPPGARYFEVLLRSTAMAGTARDTQIIAHRVVK